MFYGIHLGAISQEVLINLILKMCSEIRLLKFLPHLPDANELKVDGRPADAGYKNIGCGRLVDGVVINLCHDEFIVGNKKNLIAFSMISQNSDCIGSWTLSCEDKNLLIMQSQRQGWWCSGSWFNIKMSSYQYRISHCGDKTILRPSYLHNGISYTGKTTSLYWIGAQVTQEVKAWTTMVLT